MGGRIIIGFIMPIILQQFQQCAADSNSVPTTIVCTPPCFTRPKTSGSSSPSSPSWGSSCPLLSHRRCFKEKRRTRFCALVELLRSLIKSTQRSGELREQLGPSLPWRLRRPHPHKYFHPHKRHRPRTPPPPTLPTTSLRLMRPSAWRRPAASSAQTTSPRSPLWIFGDTNADTSEFRGSPESLTFCVASCWRSSSCFSFLRISSACH